jgi:3-isopropylmalate/(R)-2-methylmalate dehydratase small subunit
MKPFVLLNSYPVPIDRTDVDTDAILPKQYMALTSRVGFGDYLFDNWRYTEAGEPGDDVTKRKKQPDFPLNQFRYQGAQIMLCRANFGCGSSREHAVWALADWGIRAIIAPSYGDIFYGNCFKNGVLPIKLATPIVDELFNDLTRAEELTFMTIDLPEQRVVCQGGKSYTFDVDASRKHFLLSGLDEIGQILACYSERIKAFEKSRFAAEPWVA